MATHTPTALFQGESSASQSFQLRGESAKIASLSRNNHSLQIINLLRNIQTSSEKASPTARWYQITASEKLDLKTAFRKLDPSLQKAISKNLGKKTLRDLLFIGQNSDPKIFAADLYRFALMQEKEENFLLASAIYHLLPKIPQAGKWGELGKRRLEILRGGGTTGERLEFLTSTFVRDVTEPTALAAMFGAGLTFRLARFGIARSLAARGLQGPLLEGISTLGAFGLEATSFPLYGRLGSELLGRDIDWNPQALKKEIASSFLILGGLRLFGGLARRSFTRLHRIDPLTGRATQWAGSIELNRRLFTQAGMLTGILAGYKAEEFFGLRKPHPSGSIMLESLVTLLHFNIAGNLIGKITPRRVQQFERNLELKTELFSKPLWSPFLQMVTSEGIRTEGLVFMMAGPQDRKREEARPCPKAQRVLLEDKFVQEKIVDRLDEIINQAYKMYLPEGTGEIMWALPVRRMSHELRHLVRTLGKALQTHPRQKEFRPWLDRIEMDLDSIVLLFDQVQPFPEPPMTKGAREAIRNIYVATNKIVNFINDAREDDLEIVSMHTEKIWGLLKDTFEGHGKTIDPPPESLLPHARRTLLDLGRPDPELVPPLYDFFDFGMSQMVDIPTRDNRVLILGDFTGIRDEIFYNQRVDVVQNAAQPLAELRAYLREIGALDRTRLIKRNPWTRGRERYPYLEAYDVIPAAVFKASAGILLVDRLLAKLEPGGIGYLVSRDPTVLKKMTEVLSQGERAEIIEGAFHAKLPVPNFRADSTESNYLFFRKLPYSN